MTFSILLTLILLFMGVYTIVFMQKRIGRLLLACYAFGLLVVWQPQVSTFIAQRLGIGRGLDLFLILGTVILINGIIVVARHISLLHQQQTALARNIALYRARNENAGLPSIAAPGDVLSEAGASIQESGRPA
ncbi:DUF2304 family protein [Parapusillimonas sp. JC17]|uniref:DUF2304 family protein n=1 Tax=Parapusillimonas sp. JC17 TaxID=3445768 RepID=UPI003F9F781C